MLVQPPSYERRTPEQLRQHYEVERELAARLRQAGPEERPALYGALYNELFRRVPLHPQLTRVTEPGNVAAIVRDKLRLLRRFLRPETVFLELGAGDCRLTLEVAKYVRQAFALDVSDEVNRGLIPPANFRLLLSQGTDVPLPPNSVNVAYSYQLIEHLHPDDALTQLCNLRRVLAPGGIYVCVTPNRLTGPHDISRYFDRVATGFHLKEYTLAELSNLFRTTGYSRISACPGVGGRYLVLPLGLMGVIERAIESLPGSLKRRAVQMRLVENVLLSAVVAHKPQ